jgi:hypothetical protein
MGPHVRKGRFIGRDMRTEVFRQAGRWKVGARGQELAGSALEPPFVAASEPPIGNDIANSTAPTVRARGTCTALHLLVPILSAPLSTATSTSLRSRRQGHADRAERPLPLSRLIAQPTWENFMRVSA